MQSALQRPAPAIETPKRAEADPLERAQQALLEAQALIDVAAAALRAARLLSK